MTFPGMQPQKQPDPVSGKFPSGLPGEMPNIASSVSFDTGGGVTIDIGELDNTVTDIVVAWGGDEVYDSSVPNAAGQSDIRATAVSGSSYRLSVSVLYAGWTRPSIYQVSITAQADSSLSQNLPCTQHGGP